MEGANRAAKVAALAVRAGYPINGPLRSALA